MARAARCTLLALLGLLLAEFPQNAVHLGNDGARRSELIGSINKRVPREIVWNGRHTAGCSNRPTGTVPENAWTHLVVVVDRTNAAYQLVE